MVAWFMDFVDKKQHISQEKYIARWYRAAIGITTLTVKD
jgi:hypothetical protein